MLGRLGLAIILTSLTLIAFSAANFYFNADGYKHFVQLFKDVDRVMWFGPVGSYRVVPDRTDEDPIWIWLHIDWTTEAVIWVSAAFAMVAGIVGVGGQTMSIRRTAATWTIVPLVYAAATFICTLVCMIVAFVKHTKLEGSCSRFNGGRITDRTTFKCTSERVKCDLMPFITPGRNPYIDGSLCSNARTSRMLLVPLMVVSLLLVAMFGFKMFSTNKDSAAGRKDSRSDQEKLQVAKEDKR